jgi:hypothetical protein
MMLLSKVGSGTTPISAVYLKVFMAARHYNSGKDNFPTHKISNLSFIENFLSRRENRILFLNSKFGQVIQ